MLKRIIIIASILGAMPLLLIGQVSPEGITVQQYISSYAEIAVKKMKQHGIPASITLAQGILESSNGNSELAVNANNHFGIKCHKEWTGATYIKDDDARDECFRKYDSPEESFEDHSSFLCSRERYSFLFTFDEKDYKSWAYGLKKAGYATNPHYPEKLIKIIEGNQLYLFDQQGDLPVSKNAVFKVDSLRDHHKTQSKNREFSEINIGRDVRKVERNNHVKYILARKGDNTSKLAQDLDIMPWQLLRYNELDKESVLSAGQIIYLQPKKRKAEKKFHLVQDSETMYSISQKYGIKLRHLYKKNRMPRGSQPLIGQKLWLREVKPERDP